MVLSPKYQGNKNFPKKYGSVVFWPLTSLLISEKSFKRKIGDTQTGIKIIANVQTEEGETIGTATVQGSKKTTPKTFLKVSLQSSLLRGTKSDI